MTTPCVEAAERVDKPVCVERIDDLQTWQDISMGKVRWTRYLVPATEDARLPVLFVDSSSYEYHFDFLSGAFAPLFPGLTESEYARLAFNDKRREFYSGNVQHTKTAWEFTVEEVGSSPIDADDVRAVWLALSPRFGLGELVFRPSDAQLLRAPAWGVLPFAVAGPKPTAAYEVYTAATTYGTVHHVTAADLHAGAFAPTDILVLDEAPLDLSSPVAGLVTGTRQGEFSHLNVRSAARGTPNCFTDPARLAAWEGELVKLSCKSNGLSISAATPAQSLAFWDARRPAPVSVPAPDLTDTTLTGLDVLDVSTAEARALALRRYGAKGRNLAILAQSVPEAAWAKDGFLVPFAAYQDFVVTNGYDALLDGWLVDPIFLADATVRRERLDTLRSAMRKAPVDPVWLERIRDAIAARIGADVMVRFRSSSNAEDSLEFSGAGLYESVSACVADDRDADDTGPSRCDPDQPDERGVERALRRVWASLWLDRAYEERAWYGIDGRQVAMAVLVDRRAKGELANLVAFTGSPNGGREGFLVEAQAGELAVVSADPGVWPEQTLLVPRDGAAPTIERLRPSSQAPTVLTDLQLYTLYDALARVQAAFPLDATAPPDRTILLDTEWKVLADGTLVIKQARPFLARAASR